MNNMLLIITIKNRPNENSFSLSSITTCNQFGGIVFLAVDLAREISELGHDVTIYTTDLDFSNGSNKFNQKLPRLEKFNKFKINRTHVWFTLKLFFINPAMFKQIKNDKPDIIHTIGLRSFQSVISWYISKKLKIPNKSQLCFSCRFLAIPKVFRSIS